MDTGASCSWDSSAQRAGTLPLRVPRGSSREGGEINTTAPSGPSPQAWAGAPRDSGRARQDVPTRGRRRQRGAGRGRRPTRVPWQPILRYSLGDRVALRRRCQLRGEREGDPGCPSPLQQVRGDTARTPFSPPGQAPVVPAPEEGRGLLGGYPLSIPGARPLPPLTDSRLQLPMRGALPPLIPDPLDH